MGGPLNSESVKAVDGLPGWLSVHIWLPSLAPAFVDTQLLELASMLSPVSNGGFARPWFFVRYGENGPHVRLRLRVEQQANAESAEDAVGALGRKWRLSVEEYVAETERYGGADVLPACEGVFQASSDLVLQLISQKRRSLTLSERYSFSTAGALALFAGFGFSDADISTALFVFSNGSLELLPAALRYDAIAAGKTLAPALPITRSSVSQVVEQEIDSGHRMLLQSASTVHNLLRRSLGGGEPDRKLQIACSLLHMHFNRIGLSRFDEALVTRALAFRLS
jgi:thiopeptide-type bacteriocin biosynthesis protein